MPSLQSQVYAAAVSFNECFGINMYFMPHMLLISICLGCIEIQKTIFSFSLIYMLLSGVKHNLFHYTPHVCAEMPDLQGNIHFLGKTVFESIIVPSHAPPVARHEHSPRSDGPRLTLQACLEPSWTHSCRDRKCSRPCPLRSKLGQRKMSVSLCACDLPFGTPSLGAAPASAAAQRTSARRDTVHLGSSLCLPCSHFPPSQSHTCCFCSSFPDGQLIQTSENAQPSVPNSHLSCFSCQHAPGNGVLAHAVGPVGSTRSDL